MIGKRDKVTETRSASTSNRSVIWHTGVTLISVSWSWSGSELFYAQYYGQ